MVYAYSKGDEYCTSTFNGDKEIALENGYKEVSDELYAKLFTREAHWVDEELVERLKPQSEIDIEDEERRLAEIQKQISVLKITLAGSDYKAIKYAEGWITEEEYAEIKAQRQAWRDEINELEHRLL